MLKSLIVVIILMFCSNVSAQGEFENLRHVDLIDMPDAINTDHDGRYFKFKRTVPTSSSSDGQYPTITEDNNFLYITIDTDSWKRVALVSFEPPAIEGLIEIEGTSSIFLIEGTTAGSGISLE